MLLIFLLLSFIWYNYLFIFSHPFLFPSFPFSYLFILYVIHLSYLNGYFETGVETDFKNLQYRKFFSRNFFRRGKWEKFETPDFFLIAKSTASFNWWRTRFGFARVRRNLLFYKEPSFYYQLFLITKGSRDHLIFTTEGFEFNFQAAKHLSNYLHIPVYERSIEGDCLVYKPIPDPHNKALL